MLFKKVKKTPEEIKKERDEKIVSTTKALKSQINQLERKKDNLLAKVIEAKQKGLKQNEQEIRKALKVTMASIKQEESMLMSLELAVENRDLAAINMNFLELVGGLSDDIIATGKVTTAWNAKKVKEKYTKAMYITNQQQAQNDEIIDTINTTSLASTIGESINNYSEFDDEVDKMIANAEVGLRAVADADEVYGQKVK